MHMGDLRKIRMCIYCAMFNCDVTPYRLKKLLPPPKPSYPIKLPGIWKPSWGSAAGVGAGVLSFYAAGLRPAPRTHNLGIILYYYNENTTKNN